MLLIMYAGNHTYILTFNPTKPSEMSFIKPIVKWET